MTTRPTTKIGNPIGRKSDVLTTGASRNSRPAILATTGLLTVVAVVGLWQPDRITRTDFAAVSLVALGLAGVASGLAIRKPRPVRRIGILIAGGGLLLLAAAASWWLPSMVGNGLAVAGAVVAWPLAVIVFPDGRLPRTVGVGGAAVVVGAGLAAAALGGDAAGVEAVGLVVVLTLVVVVWVRFERAAERDRVAILWLTLAAVLTLMIGGHLTFLAANSVGMALAVAVSLSIPASLAVGVMHPDAADVRHLIARCVVFLVAALLVVAFFSAVVDLLILMTGRRPTRGTMAIIAVCAAAGFAPVRVALEGVIDRLLFGDRADPITAASRVGSRLSDDPVIALRALRESLGLPHARLVTHGRVVASSGPLTSVTTSVPLVAGTDEVGELVVGLRPGELMLTKADAAALRIVAPAIAQAVYANSLARELRESRTAIITVVEDERRRLRRDLHDGLGPLLTGVAYAADAARNVITDNPDRAASLLTGLRSDTSDAITEIRRLVEGLRPPALDELGLVRALRQQATRMYSADGRSVLITVEAPEPMPELPAAVEVAAYGS